MTTSTTVDAAGSTINLEEVLEAAGIRWPRNRKLPCPLHVDDTPSLHLFDDDKGGHFYCFSCGTHGLPGDLLFALTGKYPSGKRTVESRTEASDGVSVWEIRSTTDIAMRQVGIELHRTLFPDAPAFLKLQVAEAEYQAQLDLKGLAPFDARDGLAQWKRLADHYMGLFASWLEFVDEQCTEPNQHG